MKRGKLFLGSLFIVGILAISFVSASITGEVSLNTAPNDLQKTFIKSIPSVVKILNYGDLEFYAPDIEKWGKVEYLPGNIPIFTKKSGGGNFYDRISEHLPSVKGVRSKYENISLSWGTGFFINQEGYLLTNAHVVFLNTSLLEESIRTSTLNSAYDAQRLAYSWYQSGIGNYEDYINALAYYNYLYYNLKIKITHKIIAVVGSDKENFKSKEYPLNIIDMQGQFNSDPYEDLDWALLKADGTNFPSLKIGNSDDILSGEELSALGFPAVSEMQTEVDISKLFQGEEVSLDIFRRDVEPTITRGYVSSIKDIQKGYKVFQTDMSLSFGNSGGPVFDKDGEVVGIATFITGDYSGGNYNYILKINDISSKISSRVEFFQGESSKLYNSALENFWNKKYSKSKKNFNSLNNSNPDFPYLNEISSDFETKLSSGEIKISFFSRILEWFK